MSKKAKQRDCPAAGRVITAAECGEGRGSAFACPAGCVHSPFAPANYDQLLELETVVDDATLVRLLHEAPDAPGLLREIAPLMGGGHAMALHWKLARKVFYERDAAGQSVAERWEQAGFEGLKNDGRVLMRAKLKGRVALLELRQRIDAELTEVVDLLETDPRPFLLRDRRIARIEPRDTCLFAWVYPLPHYWRFHGASIRMPGTRGSAARDSLLEVVRRLGGPSAEPELRRWLGEHAVQVGEELQAHPRTARGDGQRPEGTRSKMAPVRGNP